MTTTTAPSRPIAAQADDAPDVELDLREYLSRHGWTDRDVLDTVPTDAGWRAAFEALPLAALWQLADAANAAVAAALLERTGIEPDATRATADWQRDIEALLGDEAAAQAVADQQASALAAALIDHLGVTRTARLLDYPDTDKEPLHKEATHDRRTRTRR